jgi:hypothetical protein
LLKLLELNITHIHLFWSHT